VFPGEPALRSKCWLAGQLHHFQGQDLDVIARSPTWEKTFVGSRHETQIKFNYTLNSTASQLLQISRPGTPAGIADAAGAA